MDQNIRPGECEDKPESVHDSILNSVLCEKAKSLIPEKEQGWYAQYVFHIPANTFSCYLNGTRPFPAWLAVAMDKAFKKTALLDILNESVAGPGYHRPMDPRSIKTLFVLALRQEGMFNASLAEAIADDVIDGEEAEAVDRELCKLGHFVDAMRERIAEAKKAPKTGRAS